MEELLIIDLENIDDVIYDITMEVMNTDCTEECIQKAIREYLLQHRYKITSN